MSGQPGEHPSAAQFPELVHDAIATSRVPQLLACASAVAVALERLARGAGATRWFLLRGGDHLTALEQRLSPGSLVSFYFDGRLALDVYGPGVADALLAIAEQDGDAVIGRVGRDEIELDVEFISAPAELHEYAAGLNAEAEVVYGRFPAADNDGESAVTVTVPDRDGVIRAHPH